MLSKRAEVYLGEPEFLINYFIKCEQDPYDENTNEDGLINMGTAVNALCEDMIEQRILKGDVLSHNRKWQHYYGLNGTPDLLDTAARFLTARVARNKRTVSPDNVRLINGVSAGLEVLSWIITDPDDVVLVPVPTYARFFSDMNERMKTNVVGFHFAEKEDSPFVLNGELLERAIEEQKDLGRNVKGFIFCNPHNPLGVVFDKTLTMELMRVCAKHHVHFISDEIYALSIFDKSEEFESVLQYQENELPDPERTHFLWGMSKDFGLAGFRMAFIHTYNKNVLKCLDGMSIFTSMPTHMQHVAATMLKDDQWLDNVFFPTNLKMLKTSYDFAVNKLEELGIKVLQAKAGLFIWADFSVYLQTVSREAEMDLFKKLFDQHKIYLVPGSEFGCTKFGWFRIIFALDNKKLQVAMERIKNAFDGAEKRTY